MKKNVCLSFQLHQPWRLRRFGVFDVGRGLDWFDEPANREILEGVAERCYRPVADLLLELVGETHGAFGAGFGVTGTALSQLERWAPDVIGRLRGLVATGRIEILGETSHHSLVSVFDAAELRAQVGLHRRLVATLLHASPAVFRNTELVYDDGLAAAAGEMGFGAIFAEGVERMLEGRSPNRVYRAPGAGAPKVLLRNAPLSDEIAFRFAARRREGRALTAAALAEAIAACEGDSVRLYVDVETFGEHQPEASGIFDLLAGLPRELLARGVGFQTPSEVARLDADGVIEASRTTSWADAGRDLGAWLGNALQRSAAARIHAIRPEVAASGDACILESWRRLATSDHFYYMSTRGFADGEVHEYFSPYESPYEAFLNYMNVVTDLEGRLGLRRRPDPDWRAAA